MVSKPNQSAEGFGSVDKSREDTRIEQHELEPPNRDMQDIETLWAEKSFLRPWLQGAPPLGWTI